MSISAATRAQHAYNAGFRNTDVMEALSIMVAISLAECPQGGACETGCHPDGGWDSCGIVQISMQHAAACNRACATDPASAMRYAFALSGGNNFSPWCTYDSPPGCGPRGSSAFRAHLGEARAGIATAGLGAPPPQPPPVGDGCPPGAARVNGACVCNEGTPCWNGSSCQTAPAHQYPLRDASGRVTGGCPCEAGWEGPYNAPGYAGCSPTPPPLPPGTVPGSQSGTGAVLAFAAVLGGGLLAWHAHQGTVTAPAHARPWANRGGFPGAPAPGTDPVGVRRSGDVRPRARGGFSAWM